MRIAIVGSRKFTDEFYFETRVTKILEMLKVRNSDTLGLISGGAFGVDTFAENFAKKNKLFIRVIRPDYNKYLSYQAPIERNKLIAADCDLMIAFWNGNLEKGGTRTAISFAVEMGKPVIIVPIKE